MENKPTDSNQLDTLENKETIVEASSSSGVSSDPDAESNSLESTASPTVSDANKSTTKRDARKNIRDLITHINIYLLLFILIIVIATGIAFVGYTKSKKEAVPATITTQPLSNETLSKLKESDAKVGDPKQTLTIESNAIFSGKVLIRDSLDVAGAIKVGGSLTLPGISVSGSSNFDQITANNLSVAGNMTVQGILNVQKTITSSAGASFGGPISAPQITVQSFQVTGDLQITRHIDAGGGTPGKSDGSALGSGGTSSLSGSDTAGTLTINTGGSPAAGCFATITFAVKFSGTPHVVITPIGSGAAGLNYYINRSTTSFSVCTTNAAAGGQTFSFDYVAID